MPAFPQATGRLSHVRAVWRGARLLSVLFTGTLASSLFSFTSQLVLARLLLPDDLGRFVALLAVVNFCTPLAGGGVNCFLLQVFGREGWGAARWLRPAVQVVVLLTGVSAAVLAAYAIRTFGLRGEVAALAGVAILFGQVMVEFASARLQLTGRYGLLAVWQAATPAGRLLVITVAALRPDLPAEAVLTGYAVVGLMTALSGAGLLTGLWSGRITLVGHGRRTCGLAASPSLIVTAREAGPFALVTMFYVLYFQGCVVLLEYLASPQQAAQYNAAFLVISAICLIPNVIYQKLLVAPLCRWAVHDRPSFEAAFKLGVAAMTVLGCGAMLITLIASDSIIHALFGHRYEQAGPVLALLGIGLPIRFVQSAFSSLFVSREDTARKARYLCIAALVAVAAGLLLIPPFGVTGAAVASLGAEAALLILHVRGALRHIDGVSLRAGFGAASLRRAAGVLTTEARHARA